MVPARPKVRTRQAQAGIGGDFSAVPGLNVGAIEILRRIKITVRVAVFSGNIRGMAISSGFLPEQVNPGDRAQGIVLPAFYFSKIAVEYFPGFKIHPTCRHKVAFVRVVRAFFKINRFHQFRNDEMQVGVTLSVGVRNHIDRHTVNGQPDIRAVVNVKTA